ncbi:MAG: zinc metallopeptidase [Chlorobi bacterium]|nr:zinc metallopeptidase [Chlorobiota bacterium]MBX7218244.1 zinc metallopeptidase [Candidatus Kapabacteria bacterium]
MRWRDLRQSSNIEDQRGQGGPRRGLAVGGGMGAIVIALLAYFLGVDPGAMTDQAPMLPSPSSSEATRPINPDDDSAKAFVSAVLGNTEDVWSGIMQRQGEAYRQPRLVLFSDQVQSACGVAGASVGPFYCPMDQKVYIDLSFFRELRSRFRSPGDFAQAYVIAHEVGHHVQNLLGISERVHRQQQRVGKTAANELSVRLELQADYLAGVWAHHAQKQGLLEIGDIEEALRAATAIGDDRLQMEAQGYTVPDAFTHGTSEQRARWFRKGLESGTLEGGDTFSARDL